MRGRTMPLLRSTIRLRLKFFECSLTSTNQRIKSNSTRKDFHARRLYVTANVNQPRSRLITDQMKLAIEFNDHAAFQPAKALYQISSWGSYSRLWEIDTPNQVISLRNWWPTGFRSVDKAKSEIQGMRYVRVAWRTRIPSLIRYNLSAYTLPLKSGVTALLILVFEKSKGVVPPPPRNAARKDECLKVRSCELSRL